MDRTRVPGLVLVTLLAGFAIVALLYTNSLGRRVRHQTVRVFRIARNATGISPLPSLKLKMRSAARDTLVVDVYESGRVVVLGRGDRFERQLTPAAAGEIFETGRKSLEEFDRAGCGTARGGTTAQLDVLLDGHWVGRVCPDAAEWPRGAATKRLLDRLTANVPGLSDRF